MSEAIKGSAKSVLVDMGGPFPKATQVQVPSDRSQDEHQQHGTRSHIIFLQGLEQAIVPLPHAGPREAQQVAQLHKKIAVNKSVCNALLLVTSQF